MLIGKIVLTRGLISLCFVYNDLSSAPFEMRPCLREKHRNRDILLVLVLLSSD